jgi:diaminohydroxyphosphoribosylaminopyrimidine deaminase / 5-amino-6-(5-phosphoribosylamino)uracil reductase
MDGHDTDIRHLREALLLAERGWGHVSPNPMVGAVVVDAAGEVVGRGWYEGPRGAPHAEVRAQAGAAGRARGATLYCSLEPCSHHGSTPPCTDAVISAGIQRVVVAATDPNPVVDGRGLRRLRDAGLDVRDGLLADEAHRLNAAFERHVTTGAPFLIWKIAASLDGKIAAHDGTSRWITSTEARADAHRLRAWADAVIVGAGTVLADDPRLSVRLEEMRDAWQPIRVVVDAAGRVPPTAALFDGPGQVLVATTERAEDRIGVWQSAGAEVVVLEPDPTGGVAPAGLVRELGKRDVQGALLEGGATLAWSFVRDRLVDRIVQYVAPMVIGGVDAVGIAGGEGFAPVGEGLALSFVTVERLGPDLRVEADVHRDR